MRLGAFLATGLSRRGIQAVGMKRSRSPRTTIRFRVEARVMRVADEVCKRRGVGFTDLLRSLLPLVAEDPAVVKLLAAYAAVTEATASVKQTMARSAILSSRATPAKQQSRRRPPANARFVDDDAEWDGSNSRSQQ